jgi:glycosyltransferase involved in cell wall biosynthesis
MKFSIITINYNNAAGLRRTIESVVNQTSRDYEYIVIDGGSTDSSVDVIKEYAHSITYWESELDGGIYQAMNKGVAVAHGEYCNFMNSGDAFYDNSVLDHVAEANCTEDIICGDLCYGENVFCPSPDAVTMKNFYKRSLYHQASFIHTSLLQKTPYDENLRSAADWKFFLHVLVFGNATYRHVNFLIAKFETGGFSSTNGNKGQEEIAEELHRLFPPRVLADFEDYNFGLSPFRKMVTSVEQIPPIRRLIYRLDIIVLRILNLKLKSHWISNLPGKCD